VRRPGARGECLDAAVYSLAAIAGLKAHGINADVEAARIKLTAARERPSEVREPVYRSKFIHG
jgi:hypothetical protein